MDISKIWYAIPMLVTGMLCGACGANVDTSGEPASDGGLSSLVGKSEDELASTITEQALLPHGGGGGNFNGHVSPPGVIWAVSVNAGQFVDAVSFSFFQPQHPAFPGDNHFHNGDPFSQTAFFGGGGGARNVFVCPIDQFGFRTGVIGIRGASGSLVDRFGVICGDVNNPDPNSPNNTFSPLFGGGGGNFFDDRCTPGRLVDSFNVRSGSLVDNLQAICINAR